MRFWAGLIVAAAVGLAFPGSARTARECGAEYTVKKNELTAQKIKRADFIRQCRAEPGAAAAPLPTTTAAPSSQPAIATSKGANQFQTEAQAQSHCPGGLVVWANTRSKIYHFKTNRRDYGNTKQGAYMCEADTAAAAIRAPKNEKHP